MVTFAYSEWIDLESFMASGAWTRCFKQEAIRLFVSARGIARHHRVALAAKHSETIIRRQQSFPHLVDILESDYLISDLMDDAYLILEPLLR